MLVRIVGHAIPYVMAICLALPLCHPGQWPVSSQRPVAVYLPALPHCCIWLHVAASVNCNAKILKQYSVACRGLARHATHVRAIQKYEASLQPFPNVRSHQSGGTAVFINSKREDWTGLVALVKGTVSELPGGPRSSSRLCFPGTRLFASTIDHPVTTACNMFLHACKLSLQRSPAARAGPASSVARFAPTGAVAQPKCNPSLPSAIAGPSPGHGSTSSSRAQV